MTTLAPSQTRLWTVDEYHQMAYPAIFGPDERLELIHGVVVFRSTDIPRPFTGTEMDRLIMMGLLDLNDELPCIKGDKVPDMSPMGRPHAVAIRKTTDTLENAFGSDYVVWDQSPTDVSSRSEPEPDVFVTIGNPDDYLDHAPNSDEAILVVEVSASSLRQDRTTKADLYAQGGVQDYWIVNLNDRTLEVRRQPEKGQYQELAVYKEHQTVAPLAAPHASIPVARLLPLARKSEGI